MKGAVPFMVELKEPSDKAIRINITVPERVLNLIDEAAGPLGGNRSAFMVGAAEEKARMLTQRSEKEFTAFAKAHLADSKPLRVAMPKKIGSYKVTRADSAAILSNRVMKKRTA